MIPVHNHTEYSALDGYGRPEEIAERIEKLGLPGAFVTDHGTVAGWHPFAAAMKKRDLFAGFGMEAYHARKSRFDRPKNEKGRPAKDAFHLILLAQNAQGLRNIMRLSDEANRTGFYYYPRLDKELLEKYHEGIIATTACIGGLVSQQIREEKTETLDELCRIFRDNLYVEIHTYDAGDQREVNEALVDLARKRGLPLVVANDAHYPSPEEYEVHELLLSVQMHQPFDLVDPHHPCCLYIMDEADIRQRLSYLPDDVVDEAIRSTDVLAEKCQAELGEPRLHLPKYKAEKDSRELLIDLAVQGLEERYEGNQEAAERLEYELRAIFEAGLHDYFLIVWDFIHWALKQGIMVGPGRGSAGGSILAYCLGITAVDPLRYGLMFERFWNPGRSAGLPDIDVDFEQKRRIEVKEYLARRYGEEQVMQIGNHIRMRPKSALDKTAKALFEKPPYGDLTLIKRIIDSTTDAGIQAGWTEIFEQVSDDLEPYYNKYPEMFEKAIALTGRLSTYGIHASALVVSDVPLPEELPAMLRTSKDDGEKILATQLEMHGVEERGFPKFDLLGLRNLDALKLTLELAKADFPFRDFNFNTLPDSYWMQVEKGQTLGLFQIEEGSAARRIGRDLKPRSVDELGAIVALNRPGPLRSGMVDRFLARRKGEEEVTYPHEILRDILEPTYGDFLYQEQVLAFFREIGYSLGEADDIRKILGKKLVDKMKAEFPRYLERASVFMSQANAESIWDSIIGFSKYSFNKSHAVAYGTILAWTMYAKWQWPTEFILASIITNPAKVGEYVREGKRLGIAVKPPDINKSMDLITQVGGEIYFGLRDIKGVGANAAGWIMVNGPYHSYEHFLMQLQVAQEEWEDLKGQARPRSPRQTIPRHMVDALWNAGAFDALPDGRQNQYTPEECCELEEDLLGIALTDVHSSLMDKYKAEISQLDSLVEASGTDGNVSVPGIIADVRKTTTRDDGWQGGRAMAIIKIHWEGEEAQFAAFPDIWDSYNYMLKERVMGRFDLKLTRKGSVLEKASRYV